MVVCCSSKCSVVLITLYMLCFLIFISEAAPTYVAHLCQNMTTYPNSTFQVNLNSLLPTLSSNTTSNKLFTSATAGNNTSDPAYGLYMCRGDVTDDTCHDCVVTAAREILKWCPNEKEAYIWYDECMLRYNEKSFFSRLIRDGPWVYVWNTGTVTDAARLRQILGDVMSGLATRASSGQSTIGPLKGVATDERNYSSHETLYNLVQCSPDLSGDDCNQCLGVAIGQLPACCNGRPGGRVFLPNCNIRYEMTPFYYRIPQPPPSPPSTIPPPVPGSSPNSGGNEGISAQVIIAIVVPVVVTILLFTLGFFFLRRRATKKHDVREVTTVSGINESDISAAEFLQYDLSTIEAATNNFSAENKIGQGGFGDVFKGKLSNGQEVAVKRLSESSRQGVQESKNEVLLMLKLQHRNLVRLIGFCLEQHEKILIYEFVPNKSLDYFLFDIEKQQLLDWTTRYKIIKGITRGLLYLHQDSPLRIIHRDLKASNVLLDEDMNPKISDFGMARLFDIDQSQKSSSKIAGTFGYMPPEYAMYGQFSVKSDAFSFGVLLSEIISGKKNSNFNHSGSSEDLLSHIWKLWKDGRPLDLVDPALGDSFVKDEVIRCIHIGLLCVQEDPEERPTMTSVVLMFDSNTVTLASPHQPASYLSRTDSMLKPLESDKSSSKSMPLSANEVSITELYPR